MAHASTVGWECHVCSSPGCEPVAGYEALKRVTSDCKPWPEGGTLCVCPACGCVQKILDARWHDEIDRIYRDYTIYHQSNGEEQAVFNGHTGRPTLRSDWLLQRLKAEVGIPAVGRALDVGCGNGAFLRALSRNTPGWALAGTELHDINRETVERIPGVEALYTCPVEEVPGEFDLISMVHVLEHIPWPGNLLRALKAKLKPGGHLLVQIPDYTRNPFDLLVADHASHFTPPTAARLLTDAGFALPVVATDWVTKELTLLGRPAADTNSAERRADRKPMVFASTEWLRAVVREAKASARSGRFGLFGTSISGTWLSAELGDAVEFYVDEDPSRLGKRFMNRPIFAPREAPSGGHVFLPLPRPVAESVTRRLADTTPLTFHLPPALPAAA